MRVPEYEWIGSASWTVADKDVYEEAWETGRGDLLYVEDVLAGQGQSTLKDFVEERYHVNLQQKHRPSDEPRFIDSFEDEQEAAAFIHNITYQW